MTYPPFWRFGVMAALLSSPWSCTPSPAPQLEPSGTKPSEALAAIARQCARVASCADQHDASIFRTPQACVDWYLVNARDEAPLAQCVMSARSCDDLSACTHARADQRAESFCKAHPGVLSACDGSTLLTCDGQDGVESTSLDCTTLGGACTEHAQGGLVVRGCASPKLCPQGAPEHRCDGNAVIDCDDGIVERNTCPSGSRCAPETDAYGSPTARCKSASGRECTIAGGAFCDGDVASVCVLNGRFAGLHSADCGAFGLGCAVRSGRVNCVQRGPATCTQEPATCSGSDLRFCAAGTPFTVDCKHMGFKACDPSGGGGEALCR